MDRKVRRLSHVKGSRIKSVRALPIKGEGSNGDQMMVNGRLYVKDNDRWIDIAAPSQIRNTNIFPYGLDTVTTGSDYLAGPGDTDFGATTGYVMHKDGSVISHSTCAEIRANGYSGTVAFQVRINNSNLTSYPLNNVFAPAASTDDLTSYVSVDFGSVPFSAGDLLNVRAVKDGTMAWDEVIGYFEVAFNS